MPHCPTCRGPLESTHVGATFFRVCPACQGSLIHLLDVRQAIRRDIQEQLLASVRATKAEGNRTCPTCERRMTVVTVPRGPKPVTLDLCEPCSSVWFDAREYSVLEAMYGEEETSRPFLEQKWKWALALLGMPVERDRPAVLRRPWLTWGLVGVTTLVSIAAWFMPGEFFQFALVPVHPWRWGGLTFLTCFFLHGGALHLFGNMYFLLVFGDSVEDFLGKRRYLILLLAATIAGNLLHFAAEPTSTVPLVGASGGISGLIVFYGLQFPRVRLLILLRSFFFYPLRIRAIHALLLWVLLQVSGALAQIKGFGNIAFLAHLGGGGVGFAFWLIWRNRLAVPTKPSAGSTPV